jgi:hypothetical protein
MYAGGAFLYSGFGIETKPDKKTAERGNAQMM